MNRKKMGVISDTLKIAVLFAAYFTIIVFENSYRDLSKCLIKKIDKDSFWEGALFGFFMGTVFTCAIWMFNAMKGFWSL